MTSMRRNDVASTSFRRHVPNRSLINQCQIITFLILKYDIIENSRIELRGIVLPVQVGGLLGGPKGMLAPPPLKLLGGGPAPPPPAPPPLFLRLCTILNHKSCINTFRQVLEKTLFAINAIFTQDNNLSKTKVEGPCRKQALHVQNVKQT